MIKLDLSEWFKNWFKKEIENDKSLKIKTTDKSDKNIIDKSKKIIKIKHCNFNSPDDVKLIEQIISNNEIPVNLISNLKEIIIESIRNEISEVKIEERLNNLEKLSLTKEIKLSNKEKIINLFISFIKNNEEWKEHIFYLILQTYYEHKNKNQLNEKYLVEFIEDISDVEKEEWDIIIKLLSIYKINLMGMYNPDFKKSKKKILWNSLIIEDNLSNIYEFSSDINKKYFSLLPSVLELSRTLKLVVSDRSIIFFEDDLNRNIFHEYATSKTLTLAYLFQNSKYVELNKINQFYIDLKNKNYFN